jgi:hypothetical protein
LYFDKLNKNEHKNKNEQNWIREDKNDGKQETRIDKEYEAAVDMI